MFPSVSNKTTELVIFGYYLPYFTTFYTSEFSSPRALKWHRKATEPSILTSPLAQDIINYQTTNVSSVMATTVLLMSVG
jgi:hypothetical protein